MEINKKKEFKFEGTDVVNDNTIGFIKIIERGDSQQVTVRTAKLAKVTKFLYEFEWENKDD